MKNNFFSLMRLILCLPVFLACLTVQAQNPAYNSYIEKYSPMAVEQMKRHRIPASITLAQGLLESGAGTSLLAVKANNHFGIKTGGSWTGPYVLRDDDKPNEKFRAYGSVAESYEDHSTFLLTRQRYSSLFDLAPTDYKGWAHGLKRAGYATNPRYAYNLIDLIERYGLHRYDTASQSRKEHRSRSAATPPAINVGRCNGLYYLVASGGMTYASVAKWAGLREKALRRYNEVSGGAALSAGDIVFLEKKKSKASSRLPSSRHVVKSGESLHSIAQLYGIRLESLYKMNNLAPHYVPQVGDSLKVK